MSNVKRNVAAPLWPVAVASALALGAIFTAATNFFATPVSVVLVSVGYLLGAIGTTIFSSMYRALRNSRRNHPRFRPQRALDRLAVAAVGLGVVAGVVNAVLLATELAK